MCVRGWDGGVDIDSGRPSIAFRNGIQQPDPLTFLTCNALNKSTLHDIKERKRIAFLHSLLSIVNQSPGSQDHTPQHTKASNNLIM